ELVFPGGVTAQIALARQEKYARAGAKPQVTPGTIQEDLRCRDFTVNAIALALNRAARGLLIDPMNGLADLNRHELRALQSTSLYDDPRRLLRLLRLKIRLGYTVEERTQSQYLAAREAQMERFVSRRALCEELKQIAEEPNPGEVVRVLQEEGLLALFSSALAAGKLNLAGLAKLERARRLLPPDAGYLDLNWAPFFLALTEKLSPKERAALLQATEMRKTEVSPWKNLPPRTKKLENTVKAARLKKPSQVYGVLSKAAGNEILYLLYQSTMRLVHDRIKNYLQKYLALAQEITDAEVQAAGATPGTPRFAKLKEEMIVARVDGRTKKPPPPPEPPPPLPGPRRGRPPRSLTM
ncbi:MAG: CCA tRNA nucleotidyltransferase, partial [Candidatus Solibacter usitatus]|nr:CCA tRNA nucleotidyltransferase [Candidatus Solibacter usitatus]